MLSDLELVDKVKREQDSLALKELVNRHSGVYFNKISAYSYISPVDKQELVDQKDVNIYQYVIDYDPSKNAKLSTYIGNRITYECKTLITNLVDIEQIDDSVKEDLPQKHDNEFFQFVIDNAKDMEDKRFFKIFKARHLLSKKVPWRTIGYDLNLSHEGVRKIYKTNISFLRKRLRQTRAAIRS